MSVAGNVPDRDAQREAMAAASRWRLPFSRRVWRGPAGNWTGAGAGSSLDFQDHRNYVPGDDPRHIHWQAFARTGALTMKLYRAEVAPFVDVLVDVSPSMSLTPEKETRTDALLAFCVECADRAGAPVRIHAASGRVLKAVSPAEVRTARWRERLKSAFSAPARPQNSPSSSDAHRSGAPGAALAWRLGALKVLITDVLFPDEPAPLLAPLAAGGGVGVVLAPAAETEADLVPRGNVELADCETSWVRRQRIDEGLAARYRQSYQRHFALWRDACRRRGVVFAQVPVERPLVLALGGEAFAAGAVEVVN